MEKEAFDEYKQKVASEFERVYLSPQFGEGTIKKSLLEGLVSTLDKFLIIESINYSDYSHLEKPIDYDKLSQLEYNKGLQSVVTRIRTLFKDDRIGISNLLDFVGYFPRRDANWTNEEGKESLKSNLKKCRNFGNKSADLLIDYLESEGFDFSKEYIEGVRKSIEKKEKRD